MFARMKTHFFKLLWTPVIAGCAAFFQCVPSADMYASEGAEARTVYQYVPVTPFIEPERVSRNYLRTHGPLAPFKVMPPQPSWDEVILYKQKQEALREKVKEMEMETLLRQEPQNQDDPFRGFEHKKPLEVPPLKWESATPGNARSTISEITVSPWLSVQPPPGAIPSSQPREAGDEAAGPENPLSHSGLEPAYEQPTSWIKKTGPGGAEIIIPFPSLPGTGNPSSSSAVIYTQPGPPDNVAQSPPSK
jgi:hypothetical protein